MFHPFIADAILKSSYDVGIYIVDVFKRAITQQTQNILCNIYTMLDQRRRRWADAG